MRTIAKHGRHTVNIRGAGLSTIGETARRRPAPLERPRVMAAGLNPSGLTTTPGGERTMVKKLKVAVVSLGVAALLFPASVLAQAQSGQAADRAGDAQMKLTRADFDRCNQQAMQVAGIPDADAPAAMPGAPTTPGAPGAPGAATTPGAGAAAQPGVGAQVGQQPELDRIVEAYRSCLQQAKS